MVKSYTMLGKTCRVTQPLRSEVALLYLAAVTTPVAVVDMAEESLVLVMVTVAFLVSGAEGQQTLWNCDEVSQVGNFSFQQMVAGGPWLMLEVISPVPGKNRDACTTVDFVNSSSSSSGDVLQMRSRSYGSQVFIDETTEVRLYANDSALWELPDLGSLARVTHVSDDGQLVALTVCVTALNYDWTCVLGTTPHQQGRLQEVRQSLAQRGLRNTDSPNTMNVDNCNTTTTTISESFSTTSGSEHSQ